MPETTVVRAFRENNLMLFRSAMLGLPERRYPCILMSESASELVRQLEHARALHESRAAKPELAARLDRLAAWQSRRLGATYVDLARQPRYANAIAFFQSDLYGPGDYSRRDADVARVVPLMARALPEALIGAVARAMELSVLSQELDRLMLAHLDPAAPLSVEVYCDAYRGLANREQRERQIGLIVEVGRALDRHIARSWVGAALAAMRHPARAAGFGALQSFLERGAAAFREMHGATEFLATIQVRETALMNAIFAGERTPFAEPAPSRWP